jgi:phenylacetate-CoA ligase
MELRVEVVPAQAGDAELAGRIGQALRDVTKLRGEVVLCEPGSLPNDGKVIEDARSYN